MRSRNVVEPLRISYTPGRFTWPETAIMRVPGRLHIHWQDDNTLRIDTDSGTQTRLLHFGGAPPADAAPGWQGYSVASWLGQKPISTAGAGRPPSQGTRIGGQANVERREDVAPGQGQLKVITTRMRPGYLRKNGVPYGEHATVTEYIHRLPQHPNGDVWLNVVTIVDANAVQHEVRTSEIRERRPSKTSSMPTGLVESLTCEQFTDLVGWLESLKK